MHKRKLFYVISSLEIGGAERQLIQIIVELKRKGWQPEIFVLERGGPLTSYLQQHEIPVHSISLPLYSSFSVRNRPLYRLYKYLRLFVNLLALIQILWKRKPFIIHFFLIPSYVIGGLASLIARVPIRIMSRRSLNHYQKDQILRTWIEQWLHRHMTLISGNSEAVIKDLEKEGIESERLRLIYNGINMTPYKKFFNKEIARVRAGISENTLLFIIVANLKSYKGHADLITAFSKIKNRLPEPWLLLCVGRDDGIGSILQKQAEKEGILKNIRFLKGFTDVSDFFRMADIGVLSSHQEGFSNSILEGMAAGLPMIVTDVGGNAEAVINEETGYVVSAKNTDQMAQALLKMASNPDRAEMGQKGKQRVEELFSMENCIKAYEAFYQESQNKNRTYL